MSVKDNINKTKRYIRRNGLKKAVFAVAERVTAPKHPEYGYIPASDEELLRQSEEVRIMKDKPLISLLVPAYNTKEVFLSELLESVLSQTYTEWELIIADASTTDQVAKVIERYKADKRIVYARLGENLGISGNTNEALMMAKGKYIGLFDHDDLLTPDCLYHVVTAIAKYPEAILFYSDEDKTDTEGTSFYDSNRKRAFNRDMFLTNNYICHFTCIEAETIKGLKFRPEYDGAQDYDIFLRCVENIRDDQIVHIPQILYHWRCHESSTAVNTDSKAYAYEAGLRAVKDYCDRVGWQVEVSHTDHLGFYRIDYINGIFADRPEVGAVGGPVVKLGRVVAGAIKSDGTYIYTGQPLEYTGYLHRAKLSQSVYASDIRNMQVCPLLEEDYQVIKDRLSKGEDPLKLSLEFAQIARNKGLIIIYDPNLRCK